MRAITDQLQRLTIALTQPVAQANVFELTDAPGKAQSAPFPDLDSLISGLADMAAQPSRYGIQASEDLQLLSDAHGLVQQRMQSMAAEKRARPTGPPYQQHRHKPRFEGYSPADVDQEMREAANEGGGQQPEWTQPAPKQPAAPVRRAAATRVPPPKLSPIEQLGASKVIMTHDDMWQQFPAFRDASIAHINGIARRAENPAQEAHFHAQSKKDFLRAHVDMSC